MCFFGSLFVVRLLAVAVRLWKNSLLIYIIIFFDGLVVFVCLFVCLFAVCFFGGLFVVRLLAVASRLWKNSLLIYFFFNGLVVLVCLWIASCVFLW